MKKFLVIFLVAFFLLFVNFAYGQDCGKCPFKSKCKTVKKQEPVKKENVPEPVVYVNKSDKMYHQESCKVVKNQEGYTSVVLSKALEAGMKPCTACKPLAKPVLSQKTLKKEKKIE